MRRGVAICTLLLVVTSRVAAAEPLPPKNQALLLLRILAYDHKLADRTENKRITIYVIHNANATESDAPANAMVGVLREISKSTKLAGNSVQVIKLPFNKNSFDADIGKLKAAALYVSPSLGDSLATITAVTAKRKLLSFTGTPEYVNAGVSVGFSNVNGKPVISINLPASRNEGSDLDVALLRVAKIVKK
jgi:uncharacterized protein DUF4154